jgi:hypothetical protein
VIAELESPSADMSHGIFTLKRVREIAPTKTTDVYYSVSEQFRVNFAIRLALAKILAKRTCGCAELAPGCRHWLWMRGSGVGNPATGSGWLRLSTVSRPTSRRS